MKEVPHAGPEFNRRLSLLRYIYLLLPLFPTGYLLFTFIHILKTPMPSGFASASALFANLFQEYTPVVIRFALNYLLFFAICFLGYLAFRYQSLLGKRHIAGMACLSFFIGILFLPSVYGIDITLLIYNVLGMSVQNRPVFFLNIMQPQIWVAMFTGIFLSSFLIAKTDNV